MIQWFPGHMHSTRKAIAECMPEIDVTIEMLDARLPGSSANPMLVALTSHKPALKILNKADLADPVQTEGWLAHYRAMPQTQAIALDAGERAPMAQIKQAVQALAPNRGSLGGTLSKPLRVLIGGIPNVGKSTLINTLTGKRAAKTGDEAGVTRLIQRIVLEDGFYLFDSPGVLWPKIAVEQSGVNLAATGAIKKIEIVNRFGKYGLDVLSSMLEKRILSEVRVGEFILGSNQTHLSPESIASLGAQLIQNFAKPDNGYELGLHFMGFFAEGLTEDAYRQWQLIDQEAYFKKVALAKNPLSLGKKRAFTFMITETLENREVK